MAGKDAFNVEGVVIEVRSNGTYEVELSNGHRLTAFVVGRDQRSLPRRKPGERVKLQLTPFDLTKGRILSEVGRTTGGG